MSRIRIGLALIVMVIATTPALAITPGSSMFAIQLTNGVADLTGPEVGSGYIGAYDHTEWGVQVQYWKMKGADYAFNISAGTSMFSEVDKPGDNALPGDPDLEYRQDSWNVRLGGDRVVKVGERAAIYFGPGIEYWSGSAEFDNIFAVGSTEETSTTTRISLYGRIGGVMSIGKSWGLTGHVGHRIGYATAEEAGAKATWWPSSFDGAGGLVFMFGGSE